jgi:integrase
MPAKMVQDILGHDDLDMTFDYTHTDLDMQRGMMDDLDRFFDGLS